MIWRFLKISFTISDCYFYFFRTLCVKIPWWLPQTTKWVAKIPLTMQPPLELLRPAVKKRKKVYPWVRLSHHSNFWARPIVKDVIKNVPEKVCEYNVQSGNDKNLCLYYPKELIILSTSIFVDLYFSSSCRWSLFP